MTFPAAIVEIPVGDVDKAVEYYVQRLGFTHDWGGKEGGIAGLSHGDCRLFLASPTFRQTYGTVGPVLFWLNFSNKAEVDELHARWSAMGVTIVAEPEDKPWKLREFTAADVDGNLIRVFYDFARDGLVEP